MTKPYHPAPRDPSGDTGRGRPWSAEHARDMCATHGLTWFRLQAWGPVCLDCQREHLARLRRGEAPRAEPPSPTRSREVCPDCFLERSATGSCGCD